MKKITTLCAVHRAIKNRIKGSASDIARHVGLSRSAFYKYIDEISEYGGEVVYSRTSRCFYYKTPFELKLEIQVDGMSQIYGGRNFVPSIKNGRKGFTFEK